MKAQLEQARLESLKSYEIMDTDPDSILDSMTALAAYVCDTPISLISLLDDKRQWFKSRVGLDVSETPREIAFCDFAIDQKTLFEVEDAQKDKRFCNNPLVIDDPNIRFYAGFPLINEEGYALGTLCVIDRKPRKLNEQQKNAIELLSKMAITCIETKRQQKQMKESLTSRKKLIDDIDFEMRTPLNAIMGISSILLDKNKNKSIEDELALLSSSAENMVELINNLTASNSTAYDDSPLDVDFNLRQTLNEIINNTNSNKDLEVKLIYDYAIPEIIVADEYRLSQIIYRLIASRLIGRSRTKLQITVESLDKMDDSLDICFELRDLSSSVLPQDSRSFYEQNVEKNMATDMIHGMNGEFASQLNSMKFILNFQIPKQKVNSEPELLDISGINILLVEDLETNQRIAAQFLEMWKVKYDIAENGQQAVIAVGKKQYDVVLMDMHMPVMDGYDAVKQIKSLNNGAYRKLPIIALTASVTGSDEEKINNLKLAGYVTKPFNPNVLKSTIANALQYEPS